MGYFKTNLNWTAEIVYNCPLIIIIQSLFDLCSSKEPQLNKCNRTNRSWSTPPKHPPYTSPKHLELWVITLGQAYRNLLKPIFQIETRWISARIKTRVFFIRTVHTSKLRSLVVNRLKRLVLESIRMSWITMTNVTKSIKINPLDFLLKDTLLIV